MIKLNANQLKSYNAKFEFFTKPLGPGHYEPKIDITKPKKHGSQWCASKSVRNTQNAKSVPGPGDYNSQHNTIQMTQMKNLMSQEDSFMKDRGAVTFKDLSKKVRVKPDN